MRIVKKKTILWLSVLCLTWASTGCGKSPQPEAPTPLSSLTWESSYEDMEALEGEAPDSYDSVYGGPACTYEKEYGGQKGTLKYMFDSDRKLMCIAWSYETEDPKKLDQVYNGIHGEIVERHGESGYNPANATNYGDVWYLEDGDIILSAITTQSQCALQYAYLNPLVSNQEQP